MAEEAEGDLETPTIQVLFNDLQRLLGMKLSRDLDELNDMLCYVKGEVESLIEDELSIEIKDGNRPDLWSVEGIARELKGALGIEEGFKNYNIEGYSGVEVLIEPRLQKIRPYIACAVVKGVHLDDEIIREFMHLQDKLDQTYGRKRKRTSIGLYNFNLITPPLHYGASKPTAYRFIPLEGDKEMSLKEIVESHPKGIEYGHIIKSFEYWPILHDAENRVLSFPPIINSNDLGKIKEDVKDIFIEVTGTSYLTVLNTLTMVTLSIADRGEKIFSTKVKYPYGKKKTDVTPKLEERKIILELDYARCILGLDLKDKDFLNLLRKARYGLRQIDLKTIEVTIPSYRVDVMHQVDVIEDAAIMFSYNKIKPRWPQLTTFGGISTIESLSNIARELMVGLGFQEILTFSLTNKESLFDKMNTKPAHVIEVSNPMLSKYSCLRTSLMPGLMEFLSNNTHAAYPQKIFEVGECAELNREDRRVDVEESRKLACIVAHANTSFSEIKSVLDAFLINMGLRCELDERVHKSFIEGRIGVILIAGEEIGFIGEISPQVLENWNLENPASGFEISIDKILKLRSALERRN
ncbi:MAG: phenylalanyl-tRNA synthetase beta chain [Thermoproteota archaeon]|nr:phenylalanyl-tRNA synthetase beta chain [Thermoproteota archaeon]